MKRLTLLFLLILIIPIVESRTGEMKLLAVSQTPFGLQGNLANLQLTIKPGSGRVFIDSFPLTKVDTQISTRFAKEVACNYLNLDCSNIDFFYVIRARSSIVGGPSAGAALSVLTIGLLKGWSIKEGVAITGTINSGGFIGPVGGLKEKVKAASEGGIKVVLVPRGSIYLNASNATTFNITEYGKELGVRVVEVSHLDEALPYFYSKAPQKTQHELDIDPIYSNTMRRLASLLCNRTKKLMEVAIETGINESSLEDARNLTKEASLALSQDQIYSGASFCFGANAKLSQLIAWKSMNQSQLAFELTRLKAEMLNFKSQLPEYHTLTDLETYTVVIERLTEALEYVNKSFDALFGERFKEASFHYGYARERFYSAQSWAQFFGTSTLNQDFEVSKMEKSCLQKISEADERIDYLKFYIPPLFLTGLEDDLKKAISYYDNGDYELCLFKASKVKAQANSVLISMGSNKESIREVLEHMLVYIRSNLAEQTARRHFPIVGYSYFEYSNSLKDTQIASALLYAEFALELSNLDMYFPDYRAKRIAIYDTRMISVLCIGILIGIVLGYAITRISIKTHSGARGTRSGKKR
ncbi:hypothetical protein KY318_03040 [Candidatus Woesearchaeota archaeon]|nr:hypothetical protein [Candidatus Woesearchaeota archaeon]